MGDSNPMVEMVCVIVKERELLPLRKISDNHPKILLTLDEAFGTANYDGIIKRNVLEWLLDNSLLRTAPAPL